MRERPETPGPIISFATDRVGLGPMRSDLIPAYVRWINDVEIARFASMVTPVTVEQGTRAVVLTVPSPARSDRRRGSRG